MHNNTLWLEYALNRLKQSGFQLPDNFEFENDTPEKAALPFIERVHLIEPDPAHLVKYIDEVINHEGAVIDKTIVWDEMEDSLCSERSFEVKFDNLGIRYDFSFFRTAYRSGPGSFTIRVDPKLGIYVVNGLVIEQILGQMSWRYGVELGKDFVYGAQTEAPFGERIDVFSRDFKSFKELFIRSHFQTNNPQKSIENMVQSAVATLRSIGGAYS